MNPAAPRRYYIVLGPDGKQAEGTHLYGTYRLAKRVAAGRKVVETYAMHPETERNGRALDEARSRRRS